MHCSAAFMDNSTKKTSCTTNLFDLVACIACAAVHLFTLKLQSSCRLICTNFPVKTAFGKIIIIIIQLLLRSNTYLGAFCISNLVQNKALHIEINATTKTANCGFHIICVSLESEFRPFQPARKVSFSFYHNSTCQAFPIIYYNQFEFVRFYDFFCQHIQSIFLSEKLNFHIYHRTIDYKEQFKRKKLLFFQLALQTYQFFVHSK